MALKGNPGKRTKPLLGEQVGLVPWVFAEGGFYCMWFDSGYVLDLFLCGMAEKYLFPGGSIHLCMT